MTPPVRITSYHNLILPKKLTSWWHKLAIKCQVNDQDVSCGVWWKLKRVHSTKDLLRNGRKTSYHNLILPKKLTSWWHKLAIKCHVNDQDVSCAHWFCYLVTGHWFIFLAILSLYSEYKGISHILLGKSKQYDDEFLLKNTYILTKNIFILP